MQPIATVTDSQRTRSSASRPATMFLGTVIILLSAWILGGLTHHPYLQNFTNSIFSSGLSVLRVTLIVGFGGTLLSVPLFARRVRRRENRHTVSSPPMINSQPTVHPLMMTPRPARDSSFIVRKTSKRGRISRNRAGQRLPLVDQE